MKKLSIFALVILSATAHAQGVSSTESMPIYKESSAMSPTLWFKVGPGFSSIHADDLKGASTRRALSLGAEIEMPMTESFSLQTGLNYIQKGLLVNVPGPNGQNIQGTLSLNYLELPFLAKAKIPLGSSNFALTAGPYAALALTRSANVLDQTVDVSDSVKSTDLGARFGAHFEVPVQSNMDLTVGVNYDLGLTNLSSIDNDGSAKNRTLAATVGLGIKL